jgi:hypothetical protein
MISLLTMAPPSSFSTSSSSWIKFLELFLPHFILFLLTIISWYAVETIDPIEVIDQKKPPSLPCFDSSKIQTRYCGSCRKSVEGLDHHCVWLNTCIGSKNYRQFLSLVIFGFLQMSLQTVVIGLYLTVWFKNDLKSWCVHFLLSQFVSDLSVFRIAFHRVTAYLYSEIYFIILSILCLLSIIVSIMFGVLMVFHLYLLFWARMGTYEWLLLRSVPALLSSLSSPSPPLALGTILPRVTTLSVRTIGSISRVKQQDTRSNRHGLRPSTNQRHQPLRVIMKFPLFFQLPTPTFSHWLSPHSLSQMWSQCLARLNHGPK